MREIVFLLALGFLLAAGAYGQTSNSAAKIFVGEIHRASDALVVPPKGPTYFLQKQEDVLAFLQGTKQGRLVVSNDRTVLFEFERRGDELSFIAPDGATTVLDTEEFLQDLEAEEIAQRPHLNLEFCSRNLKNIATQLEMYSTDFNGKYPTSLGGLTPDYLWRIPSCPSAGSDTYTKSFKSSTEPDLYTFYCEGENHADAGVPRNYPQYNAVEGLRTEPNSPAEFDSK